MKKIIFSLMAFVACALASCSQEEPQMTATEPLAGQWYVIYDGVDADGNITMEDPFGMGRSLLYTFNTSSNTDNVMWVSDEGNFWEFQNKVKCDVASLTFGSDEWADNIMYECKVKITNGKVVKNGATTPSGQPADAIEFDLLFDDDIYVTDYGYWDHFHVSGYRYTGFTADD